MANWKDIIGPLKNTETFKHAYAFKRQEGSRELLYFLLKRISLMLLPILLLIS